MVINIIFLVLVTVCVIRTTAYGIYCIRSGMVTGGISVLLLGAVAVLSSGFAWVK